MKFDYKIAINIFYEPTDFLIDLFNQQYSPYFPVKTNNSIKFDCKFSDSSYKSINSKNSIFNELTVWYWLWQNYDMLNLPDYIGYNHYRRIFKVEDIGNVNEYDIIVGKARLYTNKDAKLFSPRQNYCSNHYESDLNLAEQLFKKRDFLIYSKFKYFLDNGPKGKLFAPCNMFIMKKEIFFEYCKRIFPLLFELEKIIDLSNRDDYQKRAIAFISERLFSSFIFHNRYLYKIKYIPITLIN